MIYDQIWLGLPVTLKSHSFMAEDVHTLHNNWLLSVDCYDGLISDHRCILGVEIQGHIVLGMNMSYGSLHIFSCFD